MVRGTRGLAAGLAAGVLLLAGCGDDTDSGGRADGGAPSPADASVSGTPDGGTTTAPPVAEPEKGPRFPQGTGQQSDKGSGGYDLVLDDVRVGSHAGYTRLVLEFEGSAVPGWFVRYADEPRADGSGEKVKLAGAAYLDVYARRTTYPAENAAGYTGPRRIGGVAGVAEVYVVGTFEGDTQVLVGTRNGRVPFRVFALKSPSRLVVDLRG